MSDYKSKDKANPALNESKTIEVIENILSQNDGRAASAIKLQAAIRLFRRMADVILARG